MFLTTILSRKAKWRQRRKIYTNSPKWPGQDTTSACQHQLQEPEVPCEDIHLLNKENPDKLKSSRFEKTTLWVGKRQEPRKDKKPKTHEWLLHPSNARLGISGRDSFKGEESVTPQFWEARKSPYLGSQKLGETKTFWNGFTNACVSFSIARFDLVYSVVLANLLSCCDLLEVWSFPMFNLVVVVLVCL